MKLKCLDLFCGAGGASTGLYMAGFHVVGVDIQPQPHYPFQFIQADALKQNLNGYDFIWASPPCQRYSQMTKCRPNLLTKHPDLINKVRKQLTDWGGLWVIENVVGAPLRAPILLCGSMFSLPTYRHRLFESNWLIKIPPHHKHTIPTSKAGHWKPGTFISIAGHVAPIKEAREAMGIDWMNRNELAEAIPPAYAKFIGQQVKKLLR